MPFDRATRKLYNQQELGPHHNFICAGTAGVATSLVTNPIWMIKTRMQLQYKHAGTTAAGEPYTGIFNAFSRIAREEGLAAFYKGIGPSLSLVSNGALQFMFYEELKRLWKRYVLNLPYDPHAGDSEEHLNSMHFLAMGATAKVLSFTITYPLQVARARMCVFSSSSTCTSPYPSPRC